jgi:hypothetical protein
MKGMLAIKRTVFVKFQFTLEIALIFTRCIISPVAFTALQSNKLNTFSL